MFITFQRNEGDFIVSHLSIDNVRKSYHQNLHQKGFLLSEPDSISGIGEKRNRALFIAFSTMDEIHSVSVKSLAAVPRVNTPTAQVVFN